MLGAAVGVFEVRPAEAKKWQNSPGVSSKATLPSNIQMTQPSPRLWGTVRYRFNAVIGTDLQASVLGPVLVLETALTGSHLDSGK